MLSPNMGPPPPPTQPQQHHHQQQHPHHSPSQSPPLPNFHALAISPYPAHSPQPSNDYRYSGVFGPPSQINGGWSSPGKRGSRNGLPLGWYDVPNRESPQPISYDQSYSHRRDASSPPALSPPSSTASGPTTSSSQPLPHPHTHHAHHPQPNHFPTYPPPHPYDYPGSMAVTPSPPPPPLSFLSSSGSAPTLAAYQPIGLPTYGSQSLASLHSHAAQRPAWLPIANEDVIPTAIVIKNIPFSLSRETLLSIIESLGAPLPYAFNYHHDNGVFRGLAFANFRLPEEAASVVAALNGYDVQGRKLRVEYKKVLQPGEKDKIEREKALKRMRSIQFDAVPKEAPPPINTRPTTQSNGHLSAEGADSQYSPPHSASSATSDSLPITLDLNDPTALDIYSRVLVFKEDRMRDELAFSRSLTPTERRIVHLVAQKLNLVSITKGDSPDTRYVVVVREHPAPSRPNLTTSSSATLSSAYLSPYGAPNSAGDISPSLRIKKSMPDLRGFNGPVVARDPARSLTPQRSSGNLRGDGREYVSMGAAQGRRANGHGAGHHSGSGTFNSLFGSSIGEAPPVPPLPSSLGLRASPPESGMSESGSFTSSSGVMRNPRGPAGEGRGFGVGGLRASQSQGFMRMGNGEIGGERRGLGRRVSEEDEDGGGAEEGTRTRESLEI